MKLTKISFLFQLFELSPTEVGGGGWKDQMITETQWDKICANFSENQKYLDCIDMNTYSANETFTSIQDGAEEIDLGKIFAFFYVVEIFIIREHQIGNVRKHRREDPFFQQVSDK